MKISQLEKLLAVSNISKEDKQSLLKKAKEQVRLDKDKLEGKISKNLKIYFKNIQRLLQLGDKEMHLLVELVKHSTNTGDIFLHKALKDKIIKNIGFSEKTYSNKKTLLIKRKCIKRISYGVYRANPNYFGECGWDKLSEQKKIKIHVAIDERGNEIVSTSMENLKTDNVYNMEDYF